MKHVVNLVHIFAPSVVLLVSKTVLLLHAHALEVLVLALLHVAEFVRGVGVGALDLALRDVLLEVVGVL